MQYLRKDHKKVFKIKVDKEDLSGNLDKLKQHLLDLEELIPTDYSIALEIECPLTSQTSNFLELYLFLESQKKNKKMSIELTANSELVHFLMDWRFSEIINSIQ
ncbi:MAG: hypothetical protein N3A69_06465 [Leptospiraceae bacterium]|nr:hypothetical protein [Leptospiraceae bacterium]